MANLYKKNNKYYVFKNLNDVDDIDNEIKSAFKVNEVDELIAEPVKILNNKGYKTKTSCSSHYLKDASIKLIEENYKFDGSYEILDRKNIEGKDYEFSMYEECSGDGLYIQFDEMIEINSLPNGWGYDKEFNTISANVSTENYISYLTDLYNNLISLMNWVESLKDISHYGQNKFT